MKNLYLTTLLFILSFYSFSQTYKIYTAKKTGNWKISNTWNSVVRTDGVLKNKYIIPSIYTDTADNTLDYSTLGDVEVEIYGKLVLAPSTAFNLTKNSSIQVFTGSIVSIGTSAIFIGNSLKYFSMGAKTLSGPVYTNYVTAGFSTLASLAVHFVSFTATANTENSVLLQWSASDEINNKHFEIEVSYNGRDWSKIGVVKGLNRNNSINNYSFIHKNASGNMIAYRLKQVDEDDRFTYSSVAIIREMQSGKTDIYATNKIVNIAFPVGIKGAVIVKLMNMNGQVLVSQAFNNPSSKVSLNASQFNRGEYVVYVSGNSSLETVKKVFIN
jgi:hypothetical protein